jgi:triacylglycerol lipase
LVGHSMGGLAIRAWMRQFGSAHVARILTLGTPHAGTKAAKQNRTPNGRQMLWDSAWLQGLAESETPEQRALMRIALTPQDNIVFPQRAQTLPGITPVVFEGLGHVQMCSALEVINWVANELNCPPLAA